MLNPTQLVRAVLHFGAAPCTAGGDCPLHGHGGHAATSTLALAHSPAVLSSPHATTGTAWCASDLLRATGGASDGTC